ncbi:MAG: class I SAM-dependent methyltransferase [Bacteroidales bacterium]|nr:class I SAM-dependent methyltransferase [Bacteroidales bacterium]
MGKVRLKRGKEISILRGHPWIFSGAVDKTEGVVTNGETVEVISHSGQILGYGAVSLHSQIRVRMWGGAGQPVNDMFFHARIREALQRRSKQSIDKTTDAFRMVFSESDGLPGLIADQYAGCVVCQFLSAGTEYNREKIIGAIVEEMYPESVYERSDIQVREKEGLPLRKGLLAGKEPPELITIQENGLSYFVDIRQGHKTGFYLDQRESREWVTTSAGGLDTLNCFSYTGGFGIAALKGGAGYVTNIETSAECNALGQKNFILNGFVQESFSIVQDDVFMALRKYRDAGKTFDMIILDPPRFAESRSRLQGAIRGYKDINLLAMKLLSRGGILLTFSCSGHITPDIFSDIVRAAALDAGREIQIIKKFQQSADHPVMTAFPEGEYLKGQACRVW